MLNLKVSTVICTALILCGCTCCSVGHDKGYDDEHGSFVTSSTWQHEYPYGYNSHQEGNLWYTDDSTYYQIGLTK